MIKRALKSNSPSATSLQFISKFIESNFTVPESYKRYLRQALKRMEEKEKTIFKVRASFKLSAKGKGTSRSRSASPKRKASASPRAKKEKTEKEVRKPKKAEAKKEEPKKRVAKETTTEKKKKEPVAKRGKKTAKGNAEVVAQDAKYDHFWQYEENGAWKNYDTVASDTVEEVYQGYKSNRGDTDVRAVHSGQWEYQVDFLAMKQTNIQHPNHTVRNIRRVPVVKGTTS